MKNFLNTFNEFVGESAVTEAKELFQLDIDSDEHGALGLSVTMKELKDTYKKNKKDINDVEDLLLKFVYDQPEDFAANDTEGMEISGADSGDVYAMLAKEFGIKESVVTEAKGFKNTTDFEEFLKEIDAMPERAIKKIMGKDYIDTPGYYQDEKDDYEDVIDFMISNMGTSEFEKLKSWWESNVAESVVTEAKFVKDFNRDVLNAKIKEEVLELYPNAKFYVGKSDHFFGELDKNLFFKAYYTKAQKEFSIESVYSQKGSNYVHLYNKIGESVNESMSSYYFTSPSEYDQFASESPAKGETKYAVIANNRVNFNGQEIRLEGGARFGSATNKKIIGVFATEKEALASYKSAMKKPEGTFVSFSVGSVVGETKFRSQYTEIEGYLATVKVK